MDFSDDIINISDDDNDSDSKLPSPQQKKSYHTTSTRKRRSRPHKSSSRSSDTCEQSKYYKIQSLTCFVDNCSLKFPSSIHLNQHLEADHDILHYRCLQPNCNQSFQHPSQFGNHMRLEHPSPVWRCLKCGNVQKDQTSLRQHHLKYHFGTWKL